MFSSIAAAPAKQSVGETINVLSGRLGSATLLEDRRAAILGLRSFAKDYPASVASGALRSLIGSLNTDGEDVDTVKSVLETLLMLFSPNQDSPEASEEIALWLADEFTQRQENITLLLNFLESTDFHSRLYSLQLLVAILSSRTERTEECISSAPLGIPRLVAVLEDRREAIRNEALTLLTYLTPSSPLIQQSVAYQNAFERVFAIIEAEGSLLDGDRIIEDCLIFLANLLRLNPSNQSLFRESGCVLQLAKLLESTYHKRREEEEVAGWVQEQRSRNTYALLAVTRLFLVSGAVGTSQNQASFWQHGVLYHALQLAFSHDAEMPIRAEALATCAATIKGNAKLQETFAELQVPSVLDAGAVTNGQNGRQKDPPLVYVIDGLLDLSLSVPSTQAFDLRVAACQCIKAYFFGHPQVRMHFLRRAIHGHSSGVDETANVLTTLLRPVDTSAVDPYRHWFAATIMFHLIFENPEGKAIAMAVTEGDAENGEEVVTSIQTITAHLVSALSRGDDDRVSVGYLMLLTAWLFEDIDGVNDFLGEGSNIQALAQEIVRHPPSSVLIQGLCAMILGVVYEFSTKDSPIPRSTIHSVILSRVGRDKFMDSLNKLRSHPLLRDFEVTPQKADGSGNLPDVFFDATFVEFFKDNYSRIARAVDRDPGMEISVVTNGVQKGISRELVDSLRSQVEEKEAALQAALADVASLNGKLGQEQADHRRSKEASVTDLARIKSVNEAIQRNHEEELKKLETKQQAKIDAHERQLQAAQKEAAAAAETMRTEAAIKEAELQRQLEYVRKTAEADAARVLRRSEAEMADLRATISRLEVDIMKANKAKTQELQAVREELGAKLKVAEKNSNATEAKLKAAEKRTTDLETQLSEKVTAIEEVRAQVKEKEEQRSTTQTELDDLLMVFGDLEEKVDKYKKRLQGLGETVSDAEEEDDDDDDDDDDDEEDVD
ncbi:p115 like vesicle tethering protein [Xylariaceae sp. FL1272]|nr:p115 like vesicle tethering protein [Xylariaceae sp. FL1272]